MFFPIQPLIANLETDPSEETLQQVMRSPAVTDLVLHYFATDCAERALLRLQMLELPTKESGFATIRQKRAWLARTAKTEGATISSATFVSYLADTGCAGPKLGRTPDNVWRPLWAAEGAAGWCSRKEDAKGLASQVAALAREAVRSLFSDDDSHHRQQLDAWCGGPQAVADEATNAAAALEQECEWQCRRLAWWLALSEVTTRLWLAYEGECPLPPDDEALIDAGFASFPRPAPGWSGLHDGTKPFL